jgi:branched-chain amino acid transport system substrate-binding protein
MKIRGKNSRMLICLTFVWIFFYVLSTAVSAAEAPETVKLGNNLALSGGGAFWGIGYDNAIKLSAKQINEKGKFIVKGKNYKWQIITCDHKYETSEAVACANKLIYQDKVKYMMVHGGSTAIAVAPIANKEKVLMVCWAGGGKALTNPNNPLAFRHSPVDGAAMQTGLYKWLITHEKIKSIATIHPDDETGYSGGEGCKEAAEISGLKLLGQEFFPRNTTDFYPILSRLLAKKPDAIDMYFSPPGGVLLMTKQLYELGYKGVVIQYTVDPVKALEAVGPKALDKVYSYLTLATLVTPEQKKFRDDYVAAYGEWNEQALLAYDFLFTLTDCIVEGQSFDPVRVAEIMQDKEIPYLYGKGYYGMKERFGLKRQGLFPTPLAQFKDGKWQHIAFIDPEIPKTGGK